MASAMSLLQEFLQALQIAPEPSEYVAYCAPGFDKEEFPNRSRSLAFLVDVTFRGKTRSEARSHLQEFLQHKFFFPTLGEESYVFRCLSANRRNL
jgi:hypothetical protein